MQEGAVLPERIVVLALLVIAIDLIIAEVLVIVLLQIAHTVRLVLGIAGQAQEEHIAVEDLLPEGVLIVAEGAGVAHPAEVAEAVAVVADADKD